MSSVPQHYVRVGTEPLPPLEWVTAPKYRIDVLGGLVVFERHDEDYSPHQRATVQATVDAWLLRHNLPADTGEVRYMANTFEEMSGMSLFDEGSPFLALMDQLNRDVRAAE